MICTSKYELRHQPQFDAALMPQVAAAASSVNAPTGGCRTRAAASPPKGWRIDTAFDAVFTLPCWNKN
jgi:hypothetical protein